MGKAIKVSKSVEAGKAIAVVKAVKALVIPPKMMEAGRNLIAEMDVVGGLFATYEQRKNQMLAMGTKFLKLVKTDDMARAIARVHFMETVPGLSSEALSKRVQRFVTLAKTGQTQSLATQAAKARLENKKKLATAENVALKAQVEALKALPSVTVVAASTAKPNAIKAGGVIPGAVVSANQASNGSAVASMAFPETLKKTAQGLNHCFKSMAAYKSAQISITDRYFVAAFHYAAFFERVVKGEVLDLEKEFNHIVLEQQS